MGRCRPWAAVDSQTTAKLKYSAIRPTGIHLQSHCITLHQTKTKSASNWIFNFLLEMGIRWNYVLFMSYLKKVVCKWAEKFVFFFLHFMQNKSIYLGSSINPTCSLVNTTPFRLRHTERWWFSFLFSFVFGNYNFISTTRLASSGTICNTWYIIGLRPLCDSFIMSHFSSPVNFDV